jgi:hypothetical protein
MYKIKYIFNGHDFRTEGSTPLGWTYMDDRYLESVYKRYVHENLKTKWRFSFLLQLRTALAVIKHVRVFHYINIPDTEKRNTMLEFGWKDYGEKHGENIYTKFIGYHVLPKKWGIDKRKVYFSARIRSGNMTKDEAKEGLKDEVFFDYLHFTDIWRRTGITVKDALSTPKHTYKEFDHYNFRKWRPFLWVLMKMKLVPYNFYKKYATK